jgi:D-serine deaminase-like pyridoxal phosphate-dependent protein
MTEFAGRLRGLGIPVPTVSVGSTPTMSAVDHLDGVDEARPGNYIFYDAFQATQGNCHAEDCALSVLAAVVHRERSRRKVVIDAGAIALSKDTGPVEFDPACGYGRVLDLEGNDLGLRVESITQEHGLFVAADETAFDRLKVGTRVRVLANHSCLTAAQHDHYHVLEGDQIVDRWEVQRGW